MAELREILRQYQENSREVKISDPAWQQVLEVMLDYATSEIKSLFKSKIKQYDKEIWDKVATFHPDSENYSIAYKNAIIQNQALTEIEKIWEEI